MKLFGLLLIIAVALCLPQIAEAKGKRSRSGKIGKARSRSKSHRSRSRSSGSRSSKARSRSKSHRSRSRASSGGHRSVPGNHGAYSAVHSSGNSGSLYNYPLFFPITVPRLIVGDRSQSFDFYSYPYEKPGAGALEIRKPGGTVSKPLQFRASTSLERESNSISAQRLRLSMRSNRRFGVDLGLTRYREDLGGGVTDQMFQWKSVATYSFGVSELARFSVGAGLRGFKFAGGESSTGVTFRYGVELFPVKPLRVWAMGEAGANSGEFSGEIDVGAGILINRVELFAGYRGVRFVGLNFAGPVVGVAAWF